MPPAAIHVEHEFVLPDFDVGDAWDVIADTDRLNELTGLPELDLSLVSAIGGAPRFDVRMKAFPWLKWEEGFWNFVRPKTYRVRRDYRNGPMASFDGGADLFPDPQGTRIRLVADAVPRVGVLAPLVRYAGNAHARKVARALLARADARKRSGVAIFVPPSTAPAPGGSERITTGMAKVRAGAPAVAERIEGFLREAPDLDLLRIRPFELADRWKASRIEVLRGWLHAATAGLVNLSWDLICPHCRVPAIRGRTLREIAPDAACQVCSVDYAVDFDTVVEVTFSVHPSIRAVEPTLFCLGAPARRRGFLFQQLLAPGESRRVKVDLAAGEYVLGRPGSEERLPVEVGSWASASGPIRATIRTSGIHTDDGQRARVPAGEVELELVNELDVVARVSLVLGTVAHDSASAAIVTTLQEFRDLFSSEVLAEGIQIGVASVTLLFTDLKGSTAMYEKFGDAPIFARVREHFDELVAAVTAESGGVVKTIGDAVMACFTTPIAGMRAAVSMQRRMTELNHRLGMPELVVKLGMHAGPCLAVNANDRLDYFGNTVNTAARTEGQSNGGDLVITEAIAGDPEVARMLEEEGFRATRFDAELKGLAGTQSLVRVELDGAAGALARG